MIEITHTEFKPWTEGVFDIPASTYHDHRAAPEVSRSLVVEMATKSPAHVRVMIEMGGRKPTKAMVAGSLLDLALLEPEKFKEGVSHWVVPEGMNLATKDGIAWKKDHPGLPRIKPTNNSAIEASAYDIQGMIASVMKHKLGRRIVETSIKQESAFCFDPDTRLLRKCRSDARMVDNASRLTVADLKSTFPGGTALPMFAKHCASMNYHIQHAFYSDIYKDLLGEEPFFIFLVVERKPPWSVRVFQIDLEGVQAGREEYKRALESYAQCKEAGVWPQYPEVIEIVRFPRWRTRPPEPVEE